jgi:hypothetical protein
MEKLPQEQHPFTPFFDCESQPCHRDTWLCNHRRDRFQRAKHWHQLATIPSHLEISPQQPRAWVLHDNGGSKTIRKSQNVWNIIETGCATCSFGGKQAWGTASSPLSLGLLPPHGNFRPPWMVSQCKQSGDNIYSKSIGSSLCSQWKKHRQP